MRAQIFTVCLVLLANGAQIPLALAQEEAAAAEQAAADAQQTASDAEKTAAQAKQQTQAAQQATEANEKAADAATGAAADAQQQADANKAAAQKAADDRAKSQAALQSQLDAQAAMIASQSSSNLQLNRSMSELQQTLEKQQEIIKTQEQQLRTTTDALNNMQSQIDQVSVDKNKELTEDDLAMRQRLEKLESQVSTIPKDPSTLLADASFPGAIRVPGTTAAYKLGGFVKGVMVKNFDPLVTQDRFIPGSIPITATDEKALASETTLTANQTRFNFDYRQRSELGTVRAFIEGDFAGTGDTFRLRHAFGQFKDLLVGKTWSAFYDAEASPEEVDFEGINGRVVVRQSQIRYFPQVGKNVRWMISLEDPQPEVTNGTGVSDLPDLVSSVRREWFGKYHWKTAVVLRQVGAIPFAGINDTTGEQCDPNATPPEPNCTAIPGNGDTVRDVGWAFTLSGKMPFAFTGESDNVMFQFNYGEGLGRYLTDLSSVNSLGLDGGQDAIIDPTTGKLETLPAFGGYISYQHWWSKRVRSTFVFSAVNVQNLAGQLETAYHRTERLSGNLIWSPTKNVDLGAEFLWGSRTNNGPETNPDGTYNPDGAEKADATQLQLEGVYRF
jgi:hypothetical protein